MHEPETSTAYDQGEAWGEQPNKLSEGKVREQVQWFRKQVQ